MTNCCQPSGVEDQHVHGSSSLPVRLPNLRCQQFLERIVARLRGDGRFIGLLVAGSVLTADMDQYSDLDLILVCRANAFASVMAERRAVAASFGSLLAAFTGEHVGEPALLICLYDAPLLHVDLKFIVAERLGSRVENPLIAWSEDGEVAAQLAAARPQWPNSPPEWFEERFWIWVHYAAQKLGRGELFEAIEMLGLLRQQVLGPMNSRNHGRDQRGVRRVESLYPEFVEQLRQTVCGHERSDILRALHCTVTIYLQLRSAHLPANSDERRSQAVIDYLSSLAVAG